MNTLNTEERKEQATARKEKLLDVLLGIFAVIVIIVAFAFAIAIASQILEVLFVLAVLIVGSVGPKRW